MKTMLNRHMKELMVLGILASGLSGTKLARAETTISTFEDFNLDGLFSSWTSATIVSLPTNYSITATGYGSGFKTISPTLDATGETTVELTLSLSGTGAQSGPVSGPIVSLVDTDGTFYNYAWHGTHILSAAVNSPAFISATGSVAGLDLSKLAFFHLQDDPGTYTGQYTIKFNLLRLTGAPALAIASQSYDPVTQQFTLTWNSKPSKSYSILYTSDLATTFSSLVSDIVSTSTTIPVTSGQTAFLRVQEQ